MGTLLVYLIVIWHILKIAAMWFVGLFIAALLWNAGGIKDGNGNINWPVIKFLAWRVLLVSLFAGFMQGVATLDDIVW